MRGLYIHIPFCIKKCAYCDFVSFSDCERYHEKYIDELINEMGQYKNKAVDSVFIGGGTPTILNESLIEKLLSVINATFSIDKNCEFSIEANPKTLTESKLKILKKGGINRLSIGVQSFNDDELKVLGRIHSSEDAYNTVSMAKEMGFHNINIDLMSALPEQTEEKLMNSLKKAVELSPAHISCYSLIIEDGTPIERRYSKGELTVPDENDDRKMYSTVCNYLAENGYNQYEISNFAKAGYECRHNIKYWECREYIGLGVAAHSYLNGKRFYNTSDLDSYLDGKYKCDEIILSEKDMIEEFMIMGFRMKRGISTKEFKKRFAKDIKEVYGEILDKYIKSRFIIYNAGRYYLSAKGIDVSNSILCDFIM